MLSSCASSEGVPGGGGPFLSGTPRERSSRIGEGTSDATKRTAMAVAVAPSPPFMPTALDEPPSPPFMPAALDEPPSPPFMPATLDEPPLPPFIPVDLTPSPPLPPFILTQPPAPPFLPTVLNSTPPAPPFAPSSTIPGSEIAIASTFFGLLLLAFAVLCGCQELRRRRRNRSATPLRTSPSCAACGSSQ